MSLRKLFDILYIFVPFILSQIALTLYSFGNVLAVRFLASAGILHGTADQLVALTEAIYYLTGPVISAAICWRFPVPFSRWIPMIPCRCSDAPMTANSALP